jgi:hypothetical protein
LEIKTRQMKIEELTIKEAREIAAMFGAAKPQDDSHWQIGKNYFIRTVTMAHAGRLVAVKHDVLVFEDCSWVADTGRLTQALVSGDFSEVEMFPKDDPTFVFRGGCIDACVISKIPTSQK